jgi:drug/metabolite transporter (DMT)-like permease
MAILLSLLSSLMWGMSDFIGGLVSKRRPAIAVVGWSAALGLVMASIAVAAFGGWHGPYAWLPWGIAAGASGALGLGCYYAALASGTMGVVAPVTSLGVVVPIVIGLAAGENFGIFFTCVDNGAEDSPVLTLWAMRGSVTLAFVVVALVRRTTGGLAGTDFAWVLLIAAGDLSANLMFAIASTKGFVSITSVLSSLFPVVTVLLARAILRERLRLVQTLGVAVTMVGVALISFG